MLYCMYVCFVSQFTEILGGDSGSEDGSDGSTSSGDEDSDGRTCNECVLKYIHVYTCMCVYAYKLVCIHCVCLSVEEGEEAKEDAMEIQDLTESKALSLRRKIYLTLMSR